MRSFIKRLFGVNNLPFEEGPGSFGESVASLIQEYQMLSGTDQERTAILFVRRADLFQMTAPRSESTRLYRAIRSGEIASSTPGSLMDVVEKSALGSPVFFKDLLRLVARVEYRVQAGQPTFEPIYRYIDSQLIAHGFEAL
jgi:hypothetical protein